MRHVWSGQHDGCEACMGDWIIPTRSITAREALERWPAPVRSRHAPTRLSQELAVLLPEGDTTGAPKSPSKSPAKSTGSDPLERHGPGVYVVRAGRKVKIGFTDNLPLRMRELPEGATAVFWWPSPVAGWIEKGLHQHFAAQRISGEWYRLTAVDLKAVPALVVKIEKTAPALAGRYRPGRPKVAQEEQRRKARERARRWRAKGGKAA